MGSKVYSAGDLIGFSIGGGWGKEEQQGDFQTEVAIIRGADFPSIEQGIYDGLPVRWEKKAKATKAALQPGDIVLEISGGTDDRPTGRTLYITEDLLGSYDCPVIPASFCRLLRPVKDIDSAYLFFWLQNMYVKGRTWGYQNRSTGLSNFQYKVFAELEQVTVPEPESQHRIAKLLLMLEDKRHLNNRTNDYLEQCVMALFGQFYMDRWGEDLPSGWSYQRVEDFAEKVAMGPFGSNIKVETFVDKGVPIISGAHLRGLLLEELEYNHITEEHAERLANSMVYPGDIVFTHAGNIGQASLITKWAGEPKYMISQRQFYLRCNPDKMLPEIPALYFHTKVGRHVLTANSSSTGVPSIAQPSSYLKSIEVIVPAMASQCAFVDRIEPMLHQYVVNENETRKLERLRDALLPKLMSGEIDVSKVELPTHPNNHL